MACGKRIPACAGTQPILQVDVPGILVRLRFWASRIRQRRALMALDDDRLEDLGISREEAVAEAAKPFWR